MKISRAVLKETGHIALGVVIGSAVMIGVFALVGHFDFTVVLGALLGSIFSILNFLLMGLTVQKVMDLNDTVRGKILVQRSYTRRMLMMVVVIVIGFVLDEYFNVIAIAVPFLLPRLTIFVMQLLGLYQPQKEGGEKK